MTFETLGLSQPVLQALDSLGYETPSPIQTQAIPIALKGRDLFGIAQTGTGKTAAFMLPSIDRLKQSGHGAPKRGCRMLVLAPTRELAGQIADSARDYGQFANLRTNAIFGGTSVNRDRQTLARGTDILVATPGRLVDLVEQGALDLSMVEILVLDEADQMLDLGFIHALKRIVGWLPKQRQTLLFSATMPKAIKTLAGQYLTDPLQVSVAPAATTAEKVDQYVCFVGAAEKQALLTRVLREGFAAKDIDRALVFTRTKHGADRVVRKLGASGIASVAIHGNKSQSQREKALGEFKNGRTRVLVATDIAARGIDVSGVSHVLNFELPNVAEQYVHRIGRTARAGATGVAIAFCASDERPYLRDIQKLTRVTLQTMPLPDDIRSEVAQVNADSAADEAQRRKLEAERPKHQRGPRGGGGGRGRGGQGRGDNGGGQRREGQGDQPSGQRRRSNKKRYAARPAGGGGGGGGR